MAKRKPTVRIVSKLDRNVGQRCPLCGQNVPRGKQSWKAHLKSVHGVGEKQWTS